MTLTVSAVGVYGTTLTVKVCVPSKTGIEVISGLALLADCTYAASEPSVFVTVPLYTYMS